jgi:hypothetical protein
MYYCVTPVVMLLKEVVVLGKEALKLILMLHVNYSDPKKDLPVLSGVR